MKTNKVQKNCLNCTITIQLQYN